MLKSQGYLAGQCCWTEILSKTGKTQISKVRMRLQQSCNACHHFGRNTVYLKKICVCGERYLILWLHKTGPIPALATRGRLIAFVTFRNLRIKIPRPAFKPQIQVLHFSSLSALPAPFPDSECSPGCLHVTTNNYILKQIFIANTGHNN